MAIELKYTVVRPATQPTKKVTLIIDGDDVWSCEYWPDSDRSVENMGELMAREFDRHGITEKQAFNLELYGRT